jgi:hypothetical protein
MATQILNVGPAYTEDAAAAADPVGAANILVRKDTPSATVSADGDNIAQRGTNYGAAYATILTSAGAVVDTFGSGTQYTEDAVAAADPVGNVQILVRKDTLASEVSADGDNVAQRGTAKGEAYVKDADLHTLISAAYTVTTATLANVSASATSVTVFASNASAKGRIVVNDSASATLYLKFGATASTTSYTYQVGPGGTLEFPDSPLYTGICDGIWSAAVGTARTTEV